MELFDALGPAVTSTLAGRRDRLPRSLILGADAPERLAAALVGELPAVGARRVAVVFDARTRPAAGERCAAALGARGLSPEPLLLPDPEGHWPRCDEASRAWLAERTSGCDYLLGVGSGVISDLCKWVAFDADKPAAIFATAASMNGYAAANVAPAIAGVKTLILARAHRHVAADPAVLAAAPATLTSAGLGDVLAKTVSTVDWKMNELLFGEAFDPAIAGIIDGIEGRFLSRPEALARAEADAVSALFEALVFSGCAMSLQGSSMPASGGEHLLSHALDMRADAEGVEHDLHGRQVGVGTIFAAALYERVLALEAPRFDDAPLPLDREGWGPIGASVAEHHAAQSRRLVEAVARLREPDLWQELRTTLGPMLPKAAWLREVLRRAGAVHRVADLGIGRERFLWSVYNCAQIRERFTSIDLAWVSGVLPAAAPAIVDAHLS
ncbi:MAG: iron-containing alcohol dehydrogenase [Myxococcales bacterium]|nr:iron-containing alcohol dehydrogenase [Myxococcales bacterium]